MTKPLTVQKVSAAMRKAGLSAARWNASGMVRGWGDWTSGVRVTSHRAGAEIRVCYQRGNWARPTAEQEATKANEIAAALDAAGIAYERTGDGLSFICKANTDAPAT